MKAITRLVTVAILSISLQSCGGDAGGAGGTGGGSGGGNTPSRIAAGDNHSIAVMVDGSVFAWGGNNVGQLGIGYVLSDSPVPVRVPSLSDVTSVDAGGEFSVALTRDGRVFTWGRNSEGQLGLGSPAYSVATPQLSSLTNIVSIAAGSAHALAVTATGRVLSWGSNWSGELGLGYTGGLITIPAEIPGLTGVVAVAAGDGSSYALLANGTVRSWGENGDGELGLGSYQFADTPQTIPTLANVSAVSAGEGFALALTSDGTVKSWGLNYDNELGLPWVPNGTPTPTSVPIVGNASAISAGGGHGVVLLADGSVVVWGRNYWGQLGLGSGGYSVPVPTVAYAATGILPATSIAAGRDHTLVLRSDGDLFACGSNGSGELGVGSGYGGIAFLTSVVTSPTVEEMVGGGSHSVARVAGGQVFVVGSNNAYQMGSYYAFNGLNRVVELRAANIVDVASGISHILALSEDGLVSSWGANSFGQLGIGTFDFGAPVSSVGGLSDVAAVGCGREHSLAVLRNGTVMAWGNNETNQSGGGSNDIPVPTLVSGLVGVSKVAGGGRHSLALLANGTVKAWGDNDDGQLGLGFSSSTVFPPQTIPDLTGVVAIAAGDSFSMFMLSNGTVKACGGNYQGVLGVGSTALRVLSPQTVQGLAGVSAIAAGASHSMALLADGNLRIWGSNDAGQLGLFDFSPRASPTSVVLQGAVEVIGAGAGSSFARLTDGRVFAWGLNDYGQLGVVEGSYYVTAPQIVPATSPPISQFNLNRPR